MYRAEDSERAIIRIRSEPSKMGCGEGPSEERRNRGGSSETSGYGEESQGRKGLSGGQGGMGRIGGFEPCTYLDDDVAAEEVADDDILVDATGAER